MKIIHEYEEEPMVFNIRYDSTMEYWLTPIELSPFSELILIRKT